MKRLRLDTSSIVDLDSFHTEFSKLLGFPEFYGRNMDAWIDCMSYINHPEAQMSEVTVPNGEPLFLEISDTEAFLARCADMFHEFVICTAFVNQRFLAEGSATAICLVLL